jgi:hypothetical protein
MAPPVPEGPPSSISSPEPSTALQEVCIDDGGGKASSSSIRGLERPLRRLLGTVEVYKKRYINNLYLHKENT